MIPIKYGQRYRVSPKNTKGAIDAKYGRIFEGMILKYVPSDSSSLTVFVVVKQAPWNSEMEQYGAHRIGSRLHFIRWSFLTPACTGGREL